MHGKSHTRSPSVSIMSAIPLCKLPPCHLRHPMPTLSINLNVKGSLDCTIGVFHLSIPAEPFSFRMRSRFSMPSLASSSLDPIVTLSCSFYIADLSDHCSVISLSFLLSSFALFFFSYGSPPPPPPPPPPQNFSILSMAIKNKTCHKDRIARLTAPCPSH